MTDLQRTAITTLYSITILVALTGNILIIFIVSKRPETRSLTGFLFVNMAAADLLVTLLVMPISVTIPYTKMKWLSGVMGEITCKVVFYSFFVSISASISSLTFLAVHRYSGVVLPFHRFPRLRNVKFVIAVIWLVSIILMIPAAIVYKIYEGNGEVQCTPAPGFEDLFGHFQEGVTFFYTYLFLLIYFIPLLLISLLYGLVSRKLWHSKMQYRLSSGQDIAKRREASKKIVRTLVIVTADIFSVISLADCGDELWSLSKIPKSQAANNALDSRKPSRMFSIFFGRGQDPPSGLYLTSLIAHRSSLIAQAWSWDERSLANVINLRHNFQLFLCIINQSFEGQKCT